MVYHAVFDFFFCLETTGGSCVVSRASALYQLTPLVLPVHTNFYRTAMHVSKVLSPVLPLLDIPAALSCHVIIDYVLSEAPSPFKSAEVLILGNNLNNGQENDCSVETKSSSMQF
jgi:hypothetical protein